MPTSHYGKPGNSITGAKRRAVIDDIRAGELGRNAIAKKHGLSGSTVSGIAKAEGLEFRGRRQVAAATAARSVDLAARRQRIMDRIYGRVEHLQDRLEAEQFVTVFKGQYGSEYRKTLDFVPTVDERNIADTISRYVTSSSRLAELDADRRVDGAKSLLTGLGRALGITDGP